MDSELETSQPLSDEEKEPLLRYLWAFLSGSRPKMLNQMRDHLKMLGVDVPEKRLISALHSLQERITRDSMYPCTLEETLGYWYLRPKSLKLAVAMQIPYGWADDDDDKIDMAKLAKETLTLTGLDINARTVLAIIIFRRDQIDSSSGMMGSTRTGVSRIAEFESAPHIKELQTRGLIYCQTWGGVHKRRYWRPTKRLLIAAQVSDYTEIPMYLEFEKYHSQKQQIKMMNAEQRIDHNDATDRLEKQSNSVISSIKKKKSASEHMAKVHHLSIPE
jgi:hypothetical protein